MRQLSRELVTGSDVTTSTPTGGKVYSAQSTIYRVKSCDIIVLARVRRFVRDASVIDDRFDVVESSPS